jgi:hypothetical protein
MVNELSVMEADNWRAMFIGTETKDLFSGTGWRRAVKEVNYCS